MKGIKLGSGGFGEESRGPEAPNNRNVSFKDGTAVFGSGLYLVDAPGGKGKSVCSLGILNDAIKSGWSEAGHIYIFEAGAPIYLASEKRIFADPSLFMNETGGGEFIEYFQSMKTRATTEKLGMIVVDSLNDVMRGFAKGARQGQAASEGGLQPADSLFTKVLNNLGVQHSVCILGLVDTNIIPFVNRLEGSCQGIINVNSASQFLKRDRAGGRQSQSYSLSDISLQKALAVMRYPKRTGLSTTSNDIVTS